jgi:hypothetical protein
LSHPAHRRCRISFQARFSPVSAPDVVIPYAGVA